MRLGAATRLGPYEIMAPLGAGGMGEVYRASDARLKRTVAIKILRLQSGEPSVQRERFVREARTLSQLSHPSICSIYDIGHQDGCDFLVMEFIEGETLAERLRRGTIPVQECLDIAAAVADALAAAHRKGIIHRDLKPANIMLVAGGGVKVLDFGLSKVLSQETPLDSETQSWSEHTSRGVVLGTPGYMSPEQASGEPVDARSDVFSFGAVLYEMLAGNRAFPADSSVAPLRAILTASVVPPSRPGIPAAVHRILLRCLEKEAS
jgi:serine/threonine protein kinase